MAETKTARVQTTVGYKMEAITAGLSYDDDGFLTVTTYNTKVKGQSVRKYGKRSVNRLFKRQKQSWILLFSTKE